MHAYLYSLPSIFATSDTAHARRVPATHIGEWSRNVRMRNKRLVAEMEAWKYGSMEG